MSVLSKKSKIKLILCFTCGVLLTTLISCNSDNSTVHTHSYNIKLALEKYRVSSDSDLYYYSCSCGEYCRSLAFEKTIHTHRLSPNGLCLDCGETIQLCNNLVVNSIALSDIEDIQYCGRFVCKEHGIDVLKSLSYDDLEIPIIDLTGDISAATKNNTVDIIFNYFGEDTLETSGTIKLQGSSSLYYPKKNYTIKLDKKIKLNENWGKQKKYCLKANYIDYSQSRNIVSAILYGEIVHDRNIDDEINNLINGGAIDGYPVIVYNNGVFLGLYTLNIPKDKWLFGMKDSDKKNQAILMADNWNPCVFLEETVTNALNEGIALEFASNEESDVDNSTAWVAESFNNLINFVQNNEGEDFKNGINEYTDIERCIDSLIYTYSIGGMDNIAKNILWITYDGQKWYPSVYDMDGVWGLYWNGQEYIEPSELILDIAPDMLLWKRVYDNYYSDLCKRYEYLRTTVLEDSHIIETFRNFLDKIPDVVREAEKQKWQSAPSQDKNNLDQISYWSAYHLALMDIVLSD